MAVCEPLNLLLRPAGTKIMVLTTADSISEDQVTGWEHGAHVTTIATSGSRLILAAQCESRKWLPRDDKMPVNG